MKRRFGILTVVCLFFLAKGMAQNDSLAYRLTPFVSGGLSIGFFNGKASTNSVGHTGCHIGIGLQIPFQRGSQNGCCLIPSLRFITKGDTWEMAENGRVTVNMQYIEMPVDLAFRAAMKKSYLLIGGGFYLAYGIGGRMTGSDGLYIYHGYRLKEKPATFSSEVGATRWDSGISLMANYQFRHICFAADMNIGLVSTIPGRLDSNNNSKNLAISLGIGYVF